MILSFNTIAFSPLPIWGNSHPLMDCARILADIGYSGIEIIAGRPHAWPYDVSGRERKRLRKDLRELGLQIVGICPLVSPFHNPASSYPREYREAKDYIVESVRLAGDLETPYVIYPAGWVVRGTPAEEAWKRSAETIHRAAEEGKKHGVSLLIEAIRKVSSNLLWSSGLALKMMGELNHPNVRLMMDTFHVWSEHEEIENVIRAYGANLRHVHLEDISASGTERRVPGQGIHDIGKGIRALREAGYNGALSVEMWGFEPEKIARESFEYLSKLLKDLRR